MQRRALSSMVPTTQAETEPAMLQEAFFLARLAALFSFRVICACFFFSFLASCGFDMCGTPVNQ